MTLSHCIVALAVRRAAMPVGRALIVGAEREQTRLSLKCGPINCMPTGRPAWNPHGNASAGTPARLAGP